LPIRIEFVARTGSTNMDLLGRIANGEAIAEGYWLVADRQTDAPVRGSTPGLGTGR